MINIEDSKNNNDPSKLLPVRNKLHDISHGGACATSKKPVIRVQRVHCVKISVTDADDDDAHWMVRGGDDRAHGVFHISNDTIGDYEQHVIIGPTHSISEGDFADVLNDGRKVGRSVQLNRVQRML